MSRYAVGDTVAEQWLLVDQLGSGGQGVVFRACNLVDDREYGSSSFMRMGR